LLRWFLTVGLKTCCNGFLWFGLKTSGDGFLQFGIKTDDDGFSRFDLKTDLGLKIKVVESFPVWTSKPAAMVW
jgi:hypothetical protein